MRINATACSPVGIIINNSTLPPAWQLKGWHGDANNENKEAREENIRAGDACCPIKIATCTYINTRVRIERERMHGTQGGGPEFTFAYRYGEWDTFSENVAFYPINRYTLATVQLPR